MTRWTPRIPIIVTVALSCLSQAGLTQSEAHRGSVVIVTGQLGTLPIPTLMEGPASSVGNLELADQLFLRLAGLGPTLLTAGDGGFVPLLAHSWSRRDSVTLVFELDPRARWHDGAPVTARDVVFTFERAKNPAIAPRLVNLLRRIQSVKAEGDRQVVFRFSEAYPEQLYDATYHVAPLPAHLLDSVPAEAVSRSSFASRPVGSGPYRLVRSVAGQFVELAANPQFFLGKPRLERVIIRGAADPEARINMVLSGQADAVEYVIPPLDNIRRISADSTLRLIPVPSPNVGFLLFNQRDPRDSNRAHPVLSDVRVRRAITLGLDRQLIVRAVFGSYGEVPYGPVSPILWIRHHAPRAARQNLAEARRLLAAAGWRDSDGDGTLDRESIPLTLTLSLPNTSGIRRQMSLLVQEQLRQLGIKLDVQQLEFPVWSERRSSGRFDIDFGATSQDPSPSGLAQGWSCRGGTNVAKYCNPRTDSLLDQATLGRGAKDLARAWVEVLRQIEADAPATFLYAPSNVYAVKRRFRDVAISPTSSWQQLRLWSDGT
ncbi:MAG TPA: peptide ABC transporter substrate-binding protein [Gemmatimonadales bacterium]|nr:peptide ABC transporter substrate-binding protein [Gemmatimonadales bacterium]